MGGRRTVVSRFQACRSTRLACTDAHGRVEVRSRKGGLARACVWGGGLMVVGGGGVPEASASRSGRRGMMAGWGRGRAVCRP